MAVEPLALGIEERKACRLITMDERGRAFRSWSLGTLETEQEGRRKKQQQPPGLADDRLLLGERRTLDGGKKVLVWE